MDQLIPTINKLQNVFNTIGSESLQLPQIVVVGTQSSGKSSVLENLVGKSFLPRGVGIVTRRPLILQLMNVTEDTDNGEWCVFLHKPDKRYRNFDDVRLEIEAETKRKAGGNKDICDEPIGLSIYSTKVADLTLVDLPGLTKVPVGDQPPDIEKRIRKLVMKYITNPNAIILAVITANTDMATSESLQFARQCDPQGNRTVAVVTKLDLMDSGTDATDILTGRVIPVRLGIIGVVNRSQKDTKDNKTIREAVADETKYLQKHYPLLAIRNGTAYLAKTLNKILINHIKNCFPDLKLRVISMRAKTTAALSSFGDDTTDSSKTLLVIVSKFCSAYCSALDGTSQKIETTELCGGARICYIFHETFGRTLSSVQPLMGLTNLDILTAMRNATGTRPALFVPEVCFEILIKRQIAMLLEPSLRCVDLIYDEMQRVIKRCTLELHYEMARFPKLFDKLTVIVSNLLHRRIPETNTMVENLINLELAYINTMHPDFRREADIVNLLFYQDPKKDKMRTENNSGADGNQKISPALSPSPSEDGIKKDENYTAGVRWFSFLPMGQMPSPSPSNSQPGHSTPASPRSPQPDLVPSTSPKLNGRSLTEREKRECIVIERLITTYFRVVRRSIADSVPKAIMFTLVNYVKDHLHSELIEELYRTSAAAELLQEPDHVAERREEYRKMLEALNAADRILGEIREENNLQGAFLQGLAEAHCTWWTYKLKSELQRQFDLMTIRRWPKDVPRRSYKLQLVDACYTDFSAATENEKLERNRAMTF